MSWCGVIIHSSRPGIHSQLGGQTMQYAAILIALLFMLPDAPAMAAEGGGSTGGGFSQNSRAAKLTPKENAAVSYQAGLKHRDRATKLEAKAAKETRDRKLAKINKKIQKEYLKATDDFEKSIEHFSGFYEVHSSLGFALRKVGRFDASLAAYNTSLGINPAYGNAIEYRGEAYLGLNRLADAKDAYMKLFSIDLALAGQLLTAMDEWVDSRRVDPKDLDRTVVEQFATWVHQRTELASFVRPTDKETLARWAGSS